MVEGNFRTNEALEAISARKGEGYAKVVFAATQILAICAVNVEETGFRIAFRALGEILRKAGISLEDVDLVLGLLRDDFDEFLIERGKK